MNSIPQPFEQAVAQAKTNVYALLVGINAYETFPLNGPVNDVSHVETFLQSLTDSNVFVEKLADEQATRSALMDAFRRHLGKAQPGDTALFYFSGHGACEVADTTLWTEEPNGVLSGIACYNGNTAHGWEFLLTDKELRYLLRDVTKDGAVHTVVIADCCHAGDNTRSLLELGEDIPLTRTIQDTFQQRPWTAFLFNDQLTEEQARAQPLDEWLPETPHIQMAACDTDEKAMEVGGEGVFTKNLLSVLQTNSGIISYASLIDLTRQSMRFGYEQRPRLDTPTGAEVLKEKTFLGRPYSVNGSLVVLAQYVSSSGKAKGWYLNVGALHGLQPMQKVDFLYPSGKTLLTASVVNVWLDYALLTIPSDVLGQLDQKQTYPVGVSGLGYKPVKIFFASRNGSLAEQRRVIETLTSKAGDCYIPVDTEEEADYALYVRNGWYFLTLPGDEYRPLVNPVLETEPALVSNLETYIRQLSQWTYLKTLKNPKATGPGVPIEVTPEFIDAFTVSATDNDKTVLIPLKGYPAEGEVKFYKNDVTTKITNTTGEPLYCTVFYLAHTGAAMPLNVNTNTLVEPDKSIEVIFKKGDTGIRWSNSDEDVVHDYNWETVDERLLFIFTTKSDNATGLLSPDTISFLTLEALPQPPTLNSRSGDTVRGASSTSDSAEPLPTWWTQSVTLRWENPYYNKISKEDINKMIEPDAERPGTDALAECALGLYFSVNTDNLAEPTLQAKPELQAYWNSQQKDGQRGIWEDVSLAMASRVLETMRNNRFDENLKRFPNRSTVVAVGDSWFQYPLIRDIVDCLANGYSVYSLASAGKTLDDIEADDILEAIDQTKAQFLLFSVGLNDLIKNLADSFIRDTLPAGPANPRQYLNTDFFEKLDTIQQTYETLFAAVQSKYPDLYILAHGYDYIRAVNAVSADRNWLAPKLADKGITDSKTQQDLLVTVINEFNERVKNAAGKFGSMTRYLDMRGEVSNPSYWHDEIHPNDSGFLDLAYKFVQQIRAIQNPASLQSASVESVDMSDEFLNGKRLVGDPLGDATIQAIMTQGLKTELDQLLKELTQNDSYATLAKNKFSKALIEIVDPFFTESANLPVGVGDPYQLNSAADLFVDRMLPVLVLLHCKSLPISYACANGAKVLHQAGRMVEHNQSLKPFTRRLLETAQFVNDLLEKNGFEPTGKAIISVQKVRMMHASIRYYTKLRPWDTATFGEPINQEDLALGHQIFSTVILSGLRQLGLDVSDNQERYYLHLWETVSHILGVQPDLITKTQAEGEQLLQRIMDRQAAPSVGGKELTDACIEFVDGKLQGLGIKELTPRLMRFLITDKYARMLSIPGTPAKDVPANPADFDTIKTIFARWDSVNESNLLLKETTNIVLNRGLDGFLEAYLSKDQFFVPASLSDYLDQQTNNRLVEAATAPAAPTLAGVANQLRTLTQELKAINNPLGFFTLASRRLANLVAEGARTKTFVNNDTIDGIYLKTINRFLVEVNHNGSSKPVSGPWQVVFTSNKQQLTMEQHLLLAGYAHLAYDLIWVMAEEVPSVKLADYQADYEHILALYKGVCTDLVGLPGLKPSDSGWLVRLYGLLRQFVSRFRNGSLALDTVDSAREALFSAFQADVDAAWAFTSQLATTGAGASTKQAWQAHEQSTSTVASQFANPTDNNLTKLTELAQRQFPIDRPDQTAAAKLEVLLASDLFN